MHVSMQTTSVGYSALEIFPTKRQTGAGEDAAQRVGGARGGREGGKLKLGRRRGAVAGPLVGGGVGGRWELLRQFHGSPWRRIRGWVWERVQLLQL